MIEEALQKYDIQANKWYGLAKLYDVFSELGIVNMKRSSFTTDWINRRISKGVLTIPPKRQFEKYRLTGQQITDIVKAFVPGGSGIYHYDAQTTSQDQGTETGTEE